ncbi:molybdopterin-binding protein [Sedimentitalea sp. JM2-8]|uniref:Molybdopterin-binding protein n=1 Tax=Sedimentitalea xiamensis TaxID=3050037 RepID=A0ABT7F9X4_9RHOB|nr:molybdopterin-binding protein [Sedimentitalea xiamensis]MDK3071899.1 molybdopterin-binding protein [Sedimentitalea xiamensis]
MKFGPVAVSEAQGAVLAHSVKLPGARLRKGVVLTADHVAALRDAGLTQVIAARLSQGDLDENTAASKLAAVLVPDPASAGLTVTAPFTGRVNLIADTPGVAVLNVDALERFNRVHPMITIATVPPFQQMQKGGMVATIKIISYGVPGTDVDRAAACAPNALRIAPPVYETAGLVVTDIDGGPGNDKGIRAMEGRVAALGMDLSDIVTVDHDIDNLARALAGIRGDLVMILTGSATSDVDDVAPAALRRAGGVVERFGMPVDPGNLLFLGRMGGRPVIGLPGCARSPALNGADWVLSRIACGVPVTAADISAMGVGGLLKEIPTRPQPRAGRKPA